MTPEAGQPPVEGNPMSTGFENNRYAALGARGRELETKTVNSLVMAVTGEWLSGHDKPHMYLAHEVVDDKLAYLDSVSGEIASGMGTEEPPRTLTTVTLRFNSGDHASRVLVGSVGRRIDNTVKRQIAEDLRSRDEVDLTSKQAKGAAINPSDGWDPTEALQLEPGVVGPLLQDISDDGVLGYYFLEEAIDPDGPVVPVEMALSPEDSLVMAYQDLEEMLPVAQAAFVGRPGFYRTIPVPDQEAPA
jgi:hypothetical protein